MNWSTYYVDEEKCSVSSRSFAWYARVYVLRLIKENLQALYINLAREYHECCLQKQNVKSKHSFKSRVDVFSYQSPSNVVRQVVIREQRKVVEEKSPPPLQRLRHRIPSGWVVCGGAPPLLTGHSPRPGPSRTH